MDIKQTKQTPNCYGEPHNVLAALRDQAWLLFDVKHQVQMPAWRINEIEDKAVSYRRSKTGNSCISTD